ncbi:trypsin-1-like [Palaemon carinicauda]|uniref:trypsin-1-like n=1 Tax=Palaemon carinicauda TaxID=392227 RepID=UPI0035B691B9
MAIKYLLLVLAGLLVGSATSKHVKNASYPPEPRDPIQADSGNEVAGSSRHLAALAKDGRSSTGTLACSKYPTPFLLGDGDTVIFKSPRYPRRYRPRTSCSWILEGLTSDTQFSVSCSSFQMERMRRRYCPDYLNLNGKKFCGRRGKPNGWQSSDSALKIRFFSNRKRGYRGFYCRATAQVPVQPTTGTPQQTCGGSCGVPNRATRIVGGVATEVNEYPWQVAIANTGTDDFQDFYCGGSIINRRWVLSAAHCEISTNDQVIVGAHEWGNNPSSYARVNIETVINHVSYNDATYDNDIALVKVTEDFNFNNIGVGPVCLPDLGSAETYAGKKATVSGWGTLGYQTGVYPNELREAEIDVVSPLTCIADYGSGSITANMLCAGIDAGGKDSCQGDSGGPLTVEDAGLFTQIGVVSFGRDCASADYYGVYARVTRFMYWIESNVGDAGYCNAP